jgi:hypothetical protein
MNNNIDSVNKQCGMQMSVLLLCVKKCGITAPPLVLQTGADLVQLITTDTEYCGIGYQPSSPFSSSGYTVVQVGCLLTGTSAHEIGHNFGCGHDYYSAPNKYSGWSRYEGERGCRVDLLCLLCLKKRPLVVDVSLKLVP